MMQRRNSSISTIVVCVCAALSPAASLAGGVMFEDVTVAAGVDFLHYTPDPGNALYFRETSAMSAGAAAGDYDGDGFVDLFVTRINEPCLLFHNLGDGTFEEVGVSAGVDLTSIIGTLSFGSGCAWGDVDNDGDLDLYVVVMYGRNRLFINDSAGQFTEEALLRGVGATDNADVQHTSAGFGDYDRDGQLDLHVTEWAGVNEIDNENLLYHNDGAGFFTDVTTSAGTAMPVGWGFASGFADFDSDGWPDLAVAADFSTSRLLRNATDGTFTDITVSSGVASDENGMGSTVGDYDNDGDLDWFVTSIFDPDSTCDNPNVACGWGYSGNRLYRNEGGATFSDQTDAAGVRNGGWGWGASFLDFDNDGDLDLGMTNGVDFAFSAVEDALFIADPLRLWENDGSGVMTEVSATVGFTNSGSGKGFVVFDYDNDGDLDVFISNNADHPVLLRNNGGNGNKWLRMNLRGVVANRFGLGARIYVQATFNGVEQLREVNNRSNYMSHNEVTAHFGLGGGISQVYSVRVEWPASGITQVFTAISPNRVMLIHEVVLADFDTDGDVDESDLASFSACLDAGENPVSVACAPGDLNADGLTNCTDLFPFLQRWTLPQPPLALPACAAIPTVSSWGAVVLALLTLTAGTLAYRRGAVVSR